jgi:hypothetical protein
MTQKFFAEPNRKDFNNYISQIARAIQLPYKQVLEAFIGNKTVA